MDSLVVTISQPIEELEAKEYYDYTLKEIMAIPNRALRVQLLTLYKQDIINMADSRVARRVIRAHEGESIASITDAMSQFIRDNTSYYLFEGNIVMVYPKFSLAKAKEEKVCSLCTRLIHPGNRYVIYRPLIDNLTTNETFVLDRSLQVHDTCKDNLPISIAQFDAIQMGIIDYHNFDEYEGMISYSELNDRFNGGFTFKRLNK